MLVISRKCNTEIRIGPDIVIKVLEIRKGHMKVGDRCPEPGARFGEGTPPNTDRKQPSVEKDTSTGIMKARA